jgi:hypothetical protein
VQGRDESGSSLHNADSSIRHVADEWSLSRSRDLACADGFASWKNALSATPLSMWSAVVVSRALYSIVCAPE